MDEKYEMNDFDAGDMINEAYELTVIPSSFIQSSDITSNTNYIKLIRNSHDINSAVESLVYLEVENDFDQTKQALLIQCSIEDNFEELNQEQLSKLAHIFNTKAVVIFFTSKDFNSMLIYWKSKDIDYFLALAPPIKKTVIECKEVYGFIADFLIHSLSRNYLGIKRSCNHSNESNTIKMNQLVDSENLNILQLSAKAGDSKCVKTILDLGIFEDTPYEFYNAPSLALISKHYDVLFMLMEGNFTYPPFMNITKLPIEVQNYVQSCEELHEAVVVKNVTKSIEILKSNPNRRHFYNKNNQSVLKVALEKKLYNMYEILLSNDISFGPHEHFARVFAGLSESDKTVLREIHFRCSKDLPEHHMNVLMMNTSISHDDMEKEGKEELILRAYRFLNKNPNLNPILKVVAASKRFDIIFDFKRNSVAAVDPTAPPDMRGSFYINRKICVGAKQLLDPSTEHETFGTLAHELCHYAIILTFKNFAKPYTKKDQQSKQEFKEIFEFSKEHPGKDEVIDFAFKESPSVRKAELIVRAAHLIALYDNQPEKLADLQDIYTGLFSYHTNKVIPAMMDAIPSIRRKADLEIKEKDKKIFNLTRNFYIAIGLGILIAVLVGIYFYNPTYEFDKLSVEKKDQVRNAFVSYSNVSVQFKDLFGNYSIAYRKLTSEHITDMLGGVVLDFDDSQLHYLDEIINFKWDGLPEKLEGKFLESDLNFQGQNVRFKIFNDSAPDALNSLTSNQIIDVLTKKPFKIGENLRISSEFFVDRKFLPEDAQILLFEYQFGYDYRLPEFSDGSTVQERFIKERTKDKTFQRFCDEFFKQNSSYRSEIYNKVKQNSYFMTRTYDLSFKNFLFMHESSKNIIKKVEKEKIFVLSSEAGAGKTIAFEHLGIEIKERFPGKWVSYIDLKGYSKYYKYENIADLGVVESKRSTDVNKSEYFTSENVKNMLKNILNLNSTKNNFEVRIFEELFKSGNLVLVWNGYDEISPDYSDFVLNLINFIHNKTSNVQYLCTRPLYSDQLSQMFNIRPYQLVPLNGDEKKDFLKKYFLSQNIPTVQINENIQKVEKIIQQLQSEDKPRQGFNTPLMLKLIAEIYTDQLLMESGNIYGIYETFIKNKIDIWIKKGESAHETIKKLLMHDLSIMDVFQKYAFLHELRLFTKSTLGLKLQKLQIMQKQIPEDLKFDQISEMGILYINGKNKFEFAHKTFAEFFIARYFIQNIYNASDDVHEDEAELRLELFFKLVKSYGEEQTVITDFMGSYLQMNKGNKFAPAISKLLKTKFKKFLFRMLDTNYPKIFEFLFKFFNKDHDLLVDLLQVYETETFYTAIFNPSYFALATNADQIKNITKNYLNQTERDKFTTGVNQKGIFYYGLYFYEQVDAAKSHSDHNEFIKQFMYDDYWLFFQKVQNDLTEPEQKEMFLAAINPKIYLYYNRIATFVGLSDTFDYGYGDMWGRYEDLLSRNETKEALFDALVQYNEISLSGDILITILISYIEEMSLDDSEIFEMFKSKNILHESHYFLFPFEYLWTFVSNHTTKEQRRDILLQDDKDDKNLYLYSIIGDIKNFYANNYYCYYNYDFTPFKIFHRAFTVPASKTLNRTIEIYEEHFNKTEIQDLIMSSNDFLYYVVGSAEKDDFQIFVNYLKKVFEGSEQKLKDYLDRKIKPTNFTIIEFIENFRELPRAPTNWFKNLEMLKYLYNNVNL